MERRKERIGNKRKILISIIHKAVLQSAFFLSADWCLMMIAASSVLGSTKVNVVRCR